MNVGVNMCLEAPFSLTVLPVRRPSVNTAYPLLMTIFTNYPSVMPTVSLEAVISNNPKIQTIKRAQDLPNIEEFRVQHSE